MAEGRVVVSVIPLVLKGGALSLMVAQLFSPTAHLFRVAATFQRILNPRQELITQPIVFGRAFVGREFVPPFPGTPNYFNLFLLFKYF